MAPNQWPAPKILRPFLLPPRKYLNWGLGVGVPTKRLLMGVGQPGRWQLVFDTLRQVGNWIPPSHSGPGGCRINLSKCTKNAAKRGNVTLTIAYHENEINLNESLKKMTFSQKTFLTLSMVTLANRGHKTASRAEPIFWGQTNLTQWGHISPIS